MFFRPINKKSQWIAESFGAEKVDEIKIEDESNPLNGEVLLLYYVSREKFFSTTKHINYGHFEDKTFEPVAKL